MGGMDMKSQEVPSMTCAGALLGFARHLGDTITADVAALTRFPWKLAMILPDQFNASVCRAVD